MENSGHLVIVSIIRQSFVMQTVNTVSRKTCNFSRYKTLIYSNKSNGQTLFMQCAPVNVAVNVSILDSFFGILTKY